MGTILQVSTGAVIQLLPCFDGELNPMMRHSHRISTKRHGDMKSAVSRSKNWTFSQTRCASALSCSKMWKSNYPHRHINAIALHVFCGCNKTSRICHQWTRFFTIGAEYQQTAPVETCKLVPVTHYDVSVTSRLKNITSLSNAIWLLN